MKVLPWLGSGGTTLHQEQLAIRVWNGMLSKNGEIEAKGSPEVVFRIVFEDASISPFPKGDDNEKQEECSIIALLLPNKRPGKEGKTNDEGKHHHQVLLEDSL